ncbi:hypothetical protein [Streptomyces sp. NPDC091027]|uniref:hypothetical protein n=1 Tax=Streptomyces sp. NPDC091027 TaxID=3365971 RepID=UPI003811699D
MLRRLTQELGPPADEGGTAFTVVNYMSEAFCIRLSFTMKFTRWHGIGGDLSDEETEERFEGFITCPQRHGPGSGQPRPCETTRQSAIQPPCDT